MLSTIRKANQTWRPIKALVYATKGWGKTTFASTFANPILIPVEDGASAVEINSFPLCQTFQDVVDCITALHGEHDFKTVVLDSADWLEPLVWQATCDANGWASIEKPGYGRGYVEADKLWRMFIGGLDSLRANKNMDVVILAHSEVKRVEPPETDPFDKYMMRLHKRAFAMFQEYSDLVLFGNYKISVHKSEEGFGQERTRGIGTGERIIHCEERPAFDAKTRWPLPPEIYIGKDRGFVAFHKALNEATGGRYANPM